MKSVNWGIIGCGDVTEVKSGPALQNAKNSSLVAVMRRDGERAQDYAQRHHVPKWYDQADALIADPEVNAIYVATPPSTHKEYTLQAAQAGKPVYVEKPMALNYDECREMIAACREAGVALYVAYYRRGLQRFLKIKEIIDSGALGHIRFVFITLYQPVRAAHKDSDNLPWRVQPDIAGGGIFVDLASHQFDFLDYILGPIDQAQGYVSNQAGNYLAEDIVSASFVFQSGIQGSGNWCFNAYKEMDHTEIIGDKGRLIYSIFDDQPVILDTIEGREVFSIGYPDHIQQPLIQMVVDDLLGQGQCPSSGESGARASWVIDQILARYKT